MTVFGGETSSFQASPPGFAYCAGGACVLAMSGLLLQIQYLIAHAPLVAASNSAASAFEVIMDRDGFAPMFLVNVGLLVVTLSLSALMIPWQPLRQRC